jgi:hypothetical protein
MLLLLMGLTSVVAVAAIGNRLAEGVASTNTPAGSVDKPGTDRCVANQTSAPGALPSRAGHFLVGTPRTATVPIAAGRLVNTLASKAVEHGGLACGDRQGLLRLADAASGTLQSTSVRLQI